MSRGSGPPPLYGLVADRSGQSEVIGVVLIMAIAVIGIGAVVALGSSAVTQTEGTAELERVEHGMTLLDSRVAVVALGESDAQTVDLQSRSGSYTVRPGTGWIRIRHNNYTGSGDNEVVYNGSLGSVAYENDDTTIAYQGGGVWRTRGEGTSMVSPPEFHYRDATLTLPVIRIDGSGSVGGSADARITPVFRDRRVYTNETADGSTGPGSPYDVTNEAYQNPIHEGTVNITVKSEYFRGWATYFRDRTEGTVTVEPDLQRASVELVTIGDLGKFQMPQDGEAIKIRGVRGGHPAELFELTLIDDESDSASFSNLQWSLYADEGPQHFELHLEDASGATCPGGDVSATVYYSHDSGATYQSWTDQDAFRYECESNTGTDYNGDGDLEDVQLKVNFTSQEKLTYTQVKGSNATIRSFSVSNSATFDDPLEYHETHPIWEETATVTVGNRTKFDHVVDHYFSLMGPNFDLIVDDKESNTVNEDASSGELQLEGTGSQFITYLHVTENEVRLRID